mgnify:CR=1 FL=1
MPPKGVVKIRFTISQHFSFIFKYSTDAGNLFILWGLDLERGISQLTQIQSSADLGTHDLTSLHPQNEYFCAHRCISQLGADLEFLLGT